MMRVLPPIFVNALVAPGWGELPSEVLGCFGSLPW